MELVIVESPTKAKTLSSFLGKGYQVEATMGHVRDLPEKSLGVRIREDFRPDYVIIPKKKKKVDELKKIANKASRIILATDPDREGEAIAYHVAVLLLGKRGVEVGGGECLGNNASLSIISSSLAGKCPGKKLWAPSALVRIVFHEITSSAIKEALANPRGIDLNLVNAQIARRILDRLVGYKLSPLLWEKIGRKWLSAGRVQSVALRLIVEREGERKRFESKEYWKISSRFRVQSLKLKKGEEILAELVAKNGKRYERSVSFDLFDGKYKVTLTKIKNKSEAKEIIDDFKDRQFSVASVDKKEIRRVPPPPFITSTLQQEANLRFGFSSKKTMNLAQRLYELGLITYHRTDSFFLSEKFLVAARQFIKKVYGKDYALVKPRIYKTKSKLAQEAHEAIRPTSLAPQGLGFKAQGDLTRDHFKLYQLIFKRALASQAKEAVVDTTKIGILSDNGYLFEAKGSVIKFDGFLKILGISREDKILPKLRVGEKLVLVKSLPTQHFTAPPPRYTEATLVKTLERLGIGRPSTYAPIISTILGRQYVEKVEGRFVPEIIGKTVNDFLTKNFPKIIDIPFTAKMEEGLDEIAKGKKELVPLLKEFYDPFDEQLKKVYLKVKKVRLPTQETEENCPKCGGKLVVKIGKYGKFLACSSFPKCNFTAPFLEKTGVFCPKCGAELVIKKTKKGKRFYGCSNYPNCQFASWKKPKMEESGNECTL